MVSISHSKSLERAKITEMSVTSSFGGDRKRNSFTALLFEGRRGLSFFRKKKRDKRPPHLFLHLFFFSKHNNNTTPTT